MVPRTARALLPLGLLAALACSRDVASEPVPPATSASASASAPAAKPAEVVASDVTRTLPGGTSFIVPSGWSVSVEGTHAHVTSPGGDFKAAISENAASTAGEAVALAWHLLDPAFRRSARIAGSLPARHGWDDIRSYEYETSPGDGLAVNAGAMRLGESWTAVVFLDTLKTIATHGAGAALFAQSIAPKGYAKESFAGKTPRPLDAAALQQVADFVDEARNALDIPGAAIALVQGGKVVLARGFGVREVGQAVKVDADTLFAIGSNTRGLTSLLLAREMEDGKRTWDTPVTKVYPEFRLGDADRTARVLMKHLVCSCISLPFEDRPFSYAHARATPKDVGDLLATFTTTSVFGDEELAATAGYIGGHIATPGAPLGKAYEDALEANVLAPLGMRATTVDLARALAGNHASPHAYDVDVHMKVSSSVPLRATVPLRPAMGGWSSANDLGRYVAMQLSRGKLADGKPFLPEKSELAWRTSTSLGVLGATAPVDKDWGLRFAHSPGSLPGFDSDIFWLPDVGVGGVLLTSSDGGAAMRRPFVRRVIEVLFDGRPEALEDAKTEAERRNAQIRRNHKRGAAPPRADVLAKLAPHYKNDILGDLTVRQEGGASVFDLGAWKSAVASYPNDDGTTSMLTIDPGLDDWDFLVTERGGKRALVLRNTLREYVFKEAP